MNRIPDYADWLTDDRALREDVSALLDRPHAKVAEFLLPRMAEAGVRSVVEFGCRGGLLAAMLPAGVEYLGVEKNRFLLARAATRNRDKEFVVADIRTFAVSARECDLVMAWSLLKHYSLEEWAMALGVVLDCGRFGAFDVQVMDRELDNGVEYHHTFVTEPQLALAIAAAGHEEVSRAVLATGEVEGVGGMRDVAVWTRRVADADDVRD